MKRYQSQGFTLIELLVVVVLIGIITTFAVLSTGGGQLARELEEEAKRLHTLIHLAREEAIINAKEIALEINGKEYVFLGYVDNNWMALEGKIFRKRKINENFELKVDLKSETKFFEKKDDELRRLYFLSSGEQTPFELLLRIKDQGNQGYLIKGKFAGQLVLEYQEDYSQV